MTSSEGSLILDVRSVEPKLRHPMIFETFGRLEVGESMLLINDHDPKPLYYQMMAELHGQVGWQYLEQGPEVWKVRITRVGRS